MLCVFLEKVPLEYLVVVSVVKNSMMEAELLKNYSVLQLFDYRHHCSHLETIRSIDELVPI